MRFPSAVTRERGAIIAVTLVGLLLRLYRLDHQSLWVDEGYQYLFASADSFSAVLNRVLDPSISTHPPLSHLINHAFLVWSDTDFMLRLPSVLFGTASLPICYLLARRLTSVSTALLATAVLAVSPFHVWYSQEARGYAQLMFFTLLGSLLLLRALERPRWTLWIAYALAVSAGMYTHIFAVLTVLAHGIWLALFHRRSCLPFLAAGAVVLVLFLPMVSFFLDSYQGPQFAQRPESSATFSLTIFPYTAYAYAAGFSFGPSLRELKADRSLATLRQYSAALLLVATVVGALMAVSLYAMYRIRPAALIFCVLCVVLPLLGSVAFSLVPSGIFHVRYTIAAYPFFCILVGSALTFLFQKGRLLGLLFALSIFFISCMSIYNLYTESRYAKTDYRGAVETWRRESRGAPLLTNAHPPVMRYLLDTEPPCVVADDGRLVSAAERIIADGDTSRVWILVARDWHGSAANEIRRSFDLIDSHSLLGVDLLVVAVKPTQ